MDAPHELDIQADSAEALMLRQADADRYLAQARELVTDGDRYHNIADALSTETLTARAFEWQLQQLLYVQIGLCIVLFFLSLFLIHEQIALIIMLVQLPLFVCGTSMLCCTPSVTTARFMRGFFSATTLLALLLVVIRLIELIWLRSIRRRWWDWIAIALQLVDLFLCVVQLVGAIQIGRAWATLHASINWAYRTRLIDKRD